MSKLILAFLMCSVIEVPAIYSVPPPLGKCDPPQLHVAPKIENSTHPPLENRRTPLEHPRFSRKKAEKSIIFDIIKIKRKMSGVEMLWFILTNDFVRMDSKIIFHIFVAFQSYYWPRKVQSICSARFTDLTVRSFW